MAKYQPQMAKYQPQMAKYQPQMTKYQWGMAKAQLSKLRTARKEVMTTKRKMATRRNQTVVGVMDEMSLRRGIQSSPENPFYRTQGIGMVYNQSLKNVPNKRLVILLNNDLIAGCLNCLRSRSYLKLLRTVFLPTLPCHRSFLTSLSSQVLFNITVIRSAFQCHCHHRCFLTSCSPLMASEVSF